MHGKCACSNRVVCKVGTSQIKGSQCTLPGVFQISKVFITIKTTMGVCRIQQDMVNEQAVRILLECILVLTIESQSNCERTVMVI